MDVLISVDMYTVNDEKTAVKIVSILALVRT